MAASGNKQTHLTWLQGLNVCVWTVPSCSQTRLTVCFDFRHFVKLVSELEIRPACSPSTPPLTHAVFLASRPWGESPDLNAFLSRLLLRWTWADWEVKRCHKAATEPPRPHSDIHRFCCDCVPQQHFTAADWISIQSFEIMPGACIFSYFALLWPDAAALAVCEYHRSYPVKHKLQHMPKSRWSARHRLSTPRGVYNSVWEDLCTRVPTEELNLLFTLDGRA